jgi:site-specific recombinase XerD
MKVAIYPAKVRGRKVWAVSWTPAGKTRRRRFFDSKAGAEAERATILAEVAATGAAWSSLPAITRAELQTVAQEIAAAGLTLRQVWEDYRRIQRPKTRQEAGAALRECLAAKRAANRRPAYLANLETLLALFIRGREHQDVSEFTLADVEAFLPSRLSAASRASRLSRLSTWFSFAVSRGWIARNPCDDVQSITVERHAPVILSVQDSRRLVVGFRDHAAPGLAWLVLGLFAGLRPSEAERMEWAAVDLERAVVTVDAAASKVRRRRHVPLEPAAVQWLREAQRLGSVLPLASGVRRTLCDRMRGVMGWTEWPQDVLRHTAASHLVALHQDVARVALVLGNSPQVLLTHYRNLVTPEECEKFWSIRFFI